MSAVSYFRFNHKNTDGSEILSNMSPYSVEVNKVFYKTGEHAFNGLKYLTIAELYKTAAKGKENTRRKKLIDYANTFSGEDTPYETSLDAKKAGNKTSFKLKQIENDYWEENDLAAQKNIYEYKYETYDEVKEILTKHSKDIFIFIDDRAKENTRYGAKIKRGGEILGENEFGKLWNVIILEKNAKESVLVQDPSNIFQDDKGSTYIKDENGDFYDYNEFVKSGTKIKVKINEDNLKSWEELGISPKSPVDPELDVPESPSSPKPKVEILDDVPLEDVTLVGISKEKKVEKGKKEKITIYTKQILTKRITLKIYEIGNNLTELIEKKLKKIYENICTNDGYIKSDSIQQISYSSGTIEGENILFDVCFECLVFKPVEGMIIYNCIVNNISRAGIKAEVNSEISPAIIFIAKDHAYDSEYFNSIKESDTINVKVIGFRYELKDSKISIIASLIEKRNIKIVLNKS